MKKEKRVLKWIPTIASLILAAATLIVYSILYDEKSAQIYLQVIVAAFVPVVFPLIGAITKKEFPIFVGALVAIHIFLANNLGSALSFYSRFGAWDLIMHGFFGFVFAVIMCIFLLRWNGAELNKFGFLLLIFLSTAGAAALWEVWEFTCDLFLNGDAQRVKEALANGTNPIADTMTDIIITLVGVAVFYLVLFIGKLCGYKFDRQTCEKSENENKKQIGK